MSVYYVDGAVGNDGNLGTSEGAGNAWATLTKAMNTVAAGDKVWVKASATYAETMTMVTVGTQAAPTVFEGYTTATGDRGMVTVNGGAVRATGFACGSAATYYIIKDFRFTNHTGAGAGTATADNITYKKCRFDTNGGNGVSADTHCMFEGCYSHNNGGNGFDAGGFSVFIGCIAAHNSGTGFSSEGGVYYGCICQSNDSNGFESTLAGFHVFINCVVDGDAKDTNEGFSIAAAYGQSDVVVVNCVAYDCDVGIRSQSDLNTERVISRNNCVNGNTTPTTNFTTWGGGITTAPGFVNETAGDYTPDVGSPLIAAGFGVEMYGWITQTGDAKDIGVMDEVGGGGAPDYPIEDNVRNGIAYASGTMEGDLVVPVVGNVRDGTGYGADGTEFEGTLASPAEGDVEDGVDYGAGGVEYEGTFEAPIEGDVRVGVGYGANGTEFTGAMAAGGGGGVGVGIRTGGTL